MALQAMDLAVPSEATFACQLVAAFDNPSQELQHALLDGVCSQGSGAMAIEHLKRYHKHAAQNQDLYTRLIQRLSEGQALPFSITTCLLTIHEVV